MDEIKRVVADYLYLRRRSRVGNIPQMDAILSIIESRTDYRFDEPRGEDNETSAS
jgi:hypothetical protein